MVLPFVMAETCMDTVLPGENCTMLTPTITCTVYTYIIYNASHNVTNGTLTLVEDDIYSFEFNESEGDYIVKICDGSTREIKVVESESMMLAMVLGIGIIAAIFLFVAFKLEEQHFLLKLLLLIFTFIIIILIPSTLISGVSDTVTGLLKTVYWILRLVFIYMLVYLFYHWAKKSQQFAKMFPGMSRRMNKNE